MKSTSTRSYRKLRRTHSEEQIALLNDEQQSNPDYFKATNKIKRAAKTQPRRRGHFEEEKWKGRVAAYCSAESYDIDAIFSYLGRKSDLDPILHREVIQISTGFEDGGDIFIFPYGVTIFWGLNVTREKETLNDIKQFRIKPYDEIEYDDFEFWYGDSTKVVKDEIVLADHDVMTKLAFSHGIAQSIKLSVFESNIELLIDETKHLPEELSHSGKINLSRKDISKLMGKLFIHKAQVNLHSDILDVPDFFWEHDDLEKYYTIASTYLDKNQRVEVLNKRLIVVEELLDVLRSELHSKNESKLEWIIIVLIVVEVILELFDIIIVRFKLW